MSTNGGAFARLVAGGAAAATALAGFTIGLAAPAHAAVTISGSTDRRGGQLRRRLHLGLQVLRRGRRRHGRASSSTTSSQRDTQGGAFDLALEDGTYKLEFDRTSSTPSPSRVLPRQGRPRVRRRHHGRRRRAGPPGLDHRRDPDRHRHGRHDRRPPGAAAPACRRTPPTTTRSSAATRPTPTAPSASAPPEAVKLRFSGSDPRHRRSRWRSEYYSDKADLATADAVARPAPTSAPSPWPPAARISGRVTSDAGARRSTGSRPARDVQLRLHRRQRRLHHRGRRPPVRTRSAFSDPIDEFLGEYYNNVAVDEFGDPVSAPTVVTVGPGQAVTGIDAALAPKSKPALDRRRPQRHRPRPARWHRRRLRRSSPTTPRPTRVDARGRRPDDLQPRGWLRLHHARPRRRRDRVQDRGRR